MWCLALALLFTLNLFVIKYLCNKKKRLKRGMMTGTQVTEQDVRQNSFHPLFTFLFLTKPLYTHPQTPNTISKGSTREMKHLTAAKASSEHYR